MKKRKDGRQADSQSALTRPESDVKRATASVRKTGANTIEVINSRSLDDMLSDICTPTGTQHDEVAIRIVSQVAGSLVQSKATSADQSLLQAICTIAGLAPQNATEAMLATQLIATHEAAMLFM